MAENTTPSFAVDADITPLQGRYFQYAQSRISDPRVREQAYGLIKQTFGDIQQARDAQRIRQQEEEERALNMDVKRAQLDEGRLQLSMARDKFRRQQEAAQRGGSLYSNFDAVTQDPNLTPQEKIQALYNVAAQNSDFISENPAAASNLELRVKGIKAGQSSGDFLTQMSKVAQLRSQGASFGDIASGNIGGVMGGIEAQQQREEAEKKAKAAETAAEKKAKAERAESERRRQTAQDAMDISREYRDAIEDLRGTRKEGEGDDAVQVATPAENIEWGDIDDALYQLNILNLVSEKDKKDLEKVGIRTFNPDAPPVEGEFLPSGKAQKEWPEYYKKLRKRQYDVVDKVIRNAVKSSKDQNSNAAAPNQPAQPAQGFSVSGAVPLAPR